MEQDITLSPFTVIGGDRVSNQLTYIWWHLKSLISIISSVCLSPLTPVRMSVSLAAECPCILSAKLNLLPNYPLHTNCIQPHPLLSNPHQANKDVIKIQMTHSPPSTVPFWWQRCLFPCVLTTPPPPTGRRTSSVVTLWIMLATDQECKYTEQCNR